MTFGVYLLAFGNLIGALVGPLIQRFFGVPIRTLYLVGEGLIALGNILVVVFTFADLQILVLISIMVVTFSYQATLGSFYFVYMSQVATEA